MIFAVLDDSTISVLPDASAACGAFEAVDIVNGDVVFYAEDGAWMQPRVEATTRRFLGLLGGPGIEVVGLIVGGQVPASVKAFDDALSGAAAVNPNPFLPTLDLVREHVARARSKAF